MAKRDIHRTEILRYRTLPEEKAAFLLAAKIVGLEPADWVRSTLVRAANRDIRDAQEIPKSHAKSP